MSMRNGLASALLLFATAAFPALADESGYGAPIAPAELARYFAIQPAGDGLPAGSGTPEAGAKVYGSQCAMCHGDKLQGVPTAGGPALIGGRGTLASPKPVKTVESYWPYATTLYDYVWRAMPFHAPGSLSPDDVYAVSAYILERGGVVDAGTTLDAKTLPKVRMPNADGFYDGRATDLSAYAVQNGK